MNLKNIRNKIDAIDADLIKVISKRIKLIPEIAHIKKQNNIPRVNPKRESEIIKRIREIAHNSGVNKDFAEKIMKSLIKESHRIEKRILGK